MTLHKFEAGRAERFPPASLNDRARPLYSEMFLLLSRFPSPGVDFSKLAPLSVSGILPSFFKEDSVLTNQAAKHSLFFLRQAAG